MKNSALCMRSINDCQMLESVLFGPTFLTEKVQVHSDNVANLVFPVLNFSLVYSVLLVFCPTPVSIVS